MIHSVRFKAVLDTNVIFPVVIRDLAMDEYQVLESLRKNGLKDTADYLHALL